MIISTCNSFKNDWLITFKTRHAVYKAFTRGCSIGTILTNLIKVLLHEMQIIVRGWYDNIFNNLRSN